MTVTEKYLLESMASLADEESRMKASRYGERNIPGLWSGISMPPEVRSLLGYKVTEKKGDDSK